MSYGKVIEQLLEIEKEKSKKPAQKCTNDLSVELRCSSLRKKFSLEEIQRVERQHQLKGSSPIKSRMFMDEDNTLTLQKLPNDYVSEQKQRTAIQPLKILPLLAQDCEAVNAANSMENRKIGIENTSQIIRKDDDFISFSDNCFTSNNPIEEIGNSGFSNREIVSQVKFLENQKPDCANQTQLQQQEEIKNLENGKKQAFKEDVHDFSQQDEIIVLSHVRRSNKLKSILKNPSPIRQKPQFQDFSDLQLSQQTSSSLVIDNNKLCDIAQNTQELSQSLLVHSSDNNVQQIKQNIEQRNLIKIRKQSSVDCCLSRDHLRVGQDNHVQEQKGPKRPAISRSQSLNGMKKVHFSAAYQQPRPVPCEHPIIDADMFVFPTEIIQNKQQKYPFQATQQRCLSPSIHQGCYRQSITSQNTNSWSPLIRTSKTSPSTSPILRNLSPLKYNRMLLSAFKLLPADTQIPKANLKFTSEPALDFESAAQNSILQQNIPALELSQRIRSPFLKQIQQNSAFKQDTKLKNSYERSNYLTQGSYYSPCYKTVPDLSHFKYSKQTDTFQSSNGSINQLDQTLQQKQNLQQEPGNDMFPHNKQVVLCNSSSENQLQAERKGELANVVHSNYNNLKRNENEMNFSFAEKQSQEKEECVIIKETETAKNLDSQIHFADGTSQSPLLEIFKDQVISKRARVYYQRQNTNPVDSEDVKAVKTIGDTIIRSNSVK